MSEILRPTFADFKRSDPTPERQEFVANQIGDSYRTLLSNGGVITHAGRILAYTFDDVREENFTSQQAFEISENSVVRISPRRVENAIPEGRNAGVSHVYIIKPGLLDQLVIRRRKNSKWFYVRKLTEKGEFDSTISINPNLFEALSNYAGRILRDEGIRNQGFPLSKYTTDILEQILAERDIEKELK